MGAAEVLICVKRKARSFSETSESVLFNDVGKKVIWESRQNRRCPLAKPLCGIHQNVEACFYHLRSRYLKSDCGDWKK